MVNGICFKFDVSYHAVMVLLVLETGATIELVVARWKKCSSKLCLLFDPLESRSLHHRRLRKNYNFGTATSYHGLKWS